ncbi:hypothetical protein GCG54_00015573 [Colletotrichum gloeosporioides]|uniref:Uncharacterized protein n=1 Tax=Colletotrichum gloeosporioides TaxID=474922 RepID=A0A8H4CXM8_COLGL|nr:uncharacterized protein GCG54_00015573 [Colletotrichum gloeosporioides]KAF3812023.1 hypothetical protein GCG54_00015573 [Colletotrichum gloeosporioides]
MKGSSPIFEQDLIHEDSCLSDSTILATEISGVKAEYDCFGGARAYCCEPPNDDDPFVPNQNKKFHCSSRITQRTDVPATISRPKLSDTFTYMKQSLELEASHPRSL